MSICCFFGHRDFDPCTDLEIKIKKEIVKYIEKFGVNEFWLGGYGRFDSYCEKCLKEIKGIHTNIKIYWVLAYLDKKFDALDKKKIESIYEGIIYPPIEKAPKKVAIIARNRWMIQNSDFIIFYVDHSWGGAEKMLEYAKKIKKTFVNFGKYTIEN